MKLDEVLKNLEQEAIRKKVRLIECRNDEERGGMVGITGNTIRIYRAREKKGKDSIPYEKIVHLAQKHNVDLNRIFGIKEPKNKEN